MGASEDVTGPPMVRIDVRGRGASSSDGAWTAMTDTPCKPAAAVIAAPMSPLSHNTKRNLGPLLSSIRLRHDDAFEKPSTATATCNIGTDATAPRPAAPRRMFFVVPGLSPTPRRRRHRRTTARRTVLMK